MRVAVICEFTGEVRQAFATRGHDATSYDFLPSEKLGKHIQGDVQRFQWEYWKQYDLIICFPPCTDLAVSGARWFKGKEMAQEIALDFVLWCMELPAEKICIENPVGIISTRLYKPDQIIQPWQFGHAESKRTCLWLKNLPLLIPTRYVGNPSSSIYTKWGSKDRSRTFPGIAAAMAAQWGHT